MNGTMEAVIAAPKVEAFCEATDVVCSKCGMLDTWYEKLLARLKGQYASVVAVSFCPGGKEPVETLGPLQAMTTGRTEVHVPCAGVMREHLHVKCKFCGHTFLMETRS